MRFQRNCIDFMASLYIEILKCKRITNFTDLFSIKYLVTLPFPNFYLNQTFNCNYRERFPSLPQRLEVGYGAHKILWYFEWFFWTFSWVILAPRRICITSKNLIKKKIQIELISCSGTAFEKGWIQTQNSEKCFHLDWTHQMRKQCIIIDFINERKECLTPCQWHALTEI